MAIFENIPHAFLYTSRKTAKFVQQKKGKNGIGFTMIRKLK